jgi:thiamine-monophosphate kinase
MIVEGVHFLAADPPEDVAWKLVAVNLSDLAAKGARPLGVLLGYPLHEDEEWNARFLAGLGEVLHGYSVPLLGGDTVSGPAGATRMLGLTALGEAGGCVPSRSGAASGDILWVSGTIGDAGAGLRIAIGELEGPDALLARYRRPEPRLELGQALAPLAGAMMDVSDGLLIDAARIGQASALGLEVELREVPLSEPLRQILGDGSRTRIDAAIAGDDYELLFAASPAHSGDIEAVGRRLGVPVTAIGRFEDGGGLTLTENGVPLPLPPRLGYEHGSKAVQPVESLPPLP